MNGPSLWSRILVVVGGIAMLLGAIDPLEGSVVIFAAGALVLLGMFLSKEERGTLLYWAAAVFLIALGVAAMFALSSIGGIGGQSGRSMWWGILILPYPVGWVMGMASLLARLVRAIRNRHVAT